MPGEVQHRTMPVNSYADWECSLFGLAVESCHDLSAGEKLALKRLWWRYGDTAFRAPWDEIDLKLTWSQIQNFGMRVVRLGFAEIEPLDGRGLIVGRLTTPANALALIREEYERRDELDAVLRRSSVELVRKSRPLRPFEIGGGHGQA